MKSTVSKNFLPILLLFLNAAIFFKQEILNSQIFWGPDSPKYFFPFTITLSNWLKNLSVPLWTPFLHFGYPLSAEGQMGLLYPPNWLHYFFSPGFTINLLSFFHMSLAGVFAYAFARTIKLSRIPSLLVGLSYMFSAQFISHFQHLAILYEHPYIPLTSIFIYKGITENKTKMLIFASISLAIQNLPGHGNAPIITALYAALFLLFLRPKKILQYFTLIYGLYILLILPRLTDTLILISRSLRSGAVDFIDATNGSLSFFDLITYIFPQFFFENVKSSWVFSPTFHFWTYWGSVETAIYAGIPTIILALIALKSSHNLKTFFLFSFGLFFIIALGRNTPLYENTLFKIPVIGALRDPSRYMYLADFSLVCLAGLGLEKLLSVKKSIKIALLTLLIPISLFFLINYTSSFISSNPKSFISFINKYYQPLGPTESSEKILSFVINNLSPVNKETGTQFLILLISSLLIGLLAVSKNTIKKILAVLIILILSYDLQANMSVVNSHRNITPLLSPPEKLESLKNELDINQSRIFTSTNLWSDYMPSQLLPFKVMEANGSVAVPLRRNDAFLREAEKEWNENKSGKLFALGSVQKILGSKDNDFFLPRVYTVQNYIVEKDPAKIIPILKSPSFNPKTTVVLEEDPKISLPPASNTQISPVFKDNETIITTQSDNPSILVLTDTNYPGWEASIDNIKTKIYQTNYLFRSIYLPSGNHTVVFKYLPTPFYISLIISALTFLAILIYLLKPPIKLFLVLTPLLYLIFPKGPSPFDYYTRLSQSLIQGKIYLTENPSWLNELIPDPDGSKKYYIAYPPMPAIISLPFIFLNNNISQTTISIIIGSLNTLLAFLIAKKIISDKNSKTPIWIALLFAFGTNHFFLSTVGSAWYFAHIVSVFFLFLAILETLGRKRPLLIGLLLGASYWARLPTILSLPFFLLMILSEKMSLRGAIATWQSRRKLKFGWDCFASLAMTLLGLSFFLELNFLYNFLRFGTIFDIGYTLIPNVLSEPWYRYGIFSLKYIPEHLKIIFTSLPEIKNQFPYVFPGFVGLALWFVTPAFLIALKAPLKRLLTISSWIAVFLVALPSLMHGTVGFSQFGYRFAMDYTPFLIILTILGIGKDIKWPHKLLIILSILINLWGVLLNRFSLAQF